MNCLTKLFQQKRRRNGYILAFSGPMISKRDSSENVYNNYSVPLSPSSPSRAGVLYSKKAKKICLFLAFLCRGDRIRTCDHLFPKQERYRAALHPAYSSLRYLLSIALSIISELRVQRYYIFSIPPNFSLTFFKKRCI